MARVGVNDRCVSRIVGLASLADIVEGMLAGRLGLDVTVKSLRVEGSAPAPWGERHRHLRVKSR